VSSRVTTKNKNADPVVVPPQWWRSFEDPELLEAPFSFFKIQRISLEIRKYARQMAFKEGGEKTNLTVLEALYHQEMNWKLAEIIAANWMIENGYREVRLTPPGADGGLDVVSKRAVAQVKHHQKPTGLSDVQRHYGIAKSVKKTPLFFSKSGFTPVALKWAKDNGVKCFTLSPHVELITN